jgi:hypothetical protein
MTPTKHIEQARQLTEENGGPSEEERDTPYKQGE